MAGTRRLVKASVLIFFLHCATTFFMTGVIWFVQVVHYPLFEFVGGRFSTYAHEHTRRTTPVVAPVMILELLSGLWLVWSADAAMTLGLRVNAGILLLIWISTFIVQMPLHHRLREGDGARLIPRLVAGNWIRTLCWSARAILLLWLLSSPAS